MDELLERQIPRFDEPGDWTNVLERARRHRRPRRRLLVMAATALAVLVVAPALAVVLRDGGVQLPSEADRSNVVLIMQPLTGRVLLEAAPWKGHAGFCYLVLRVRAGCVPHKARGTGLLFPPLFGWSFDPRVRSGTATTLGGKHLPLTVRHFGGKIDATLFLIRDRLPRLLREVVLRDANGRVVARARIKR
jgi:hypothetical protein